MYNYAFVAGSYIDFKENVLKIKVLNQKNARASYDIFSIKIDGRMKDFLTANIFNKSSNLMIKGRLVPVDDKCEFVAENIIEVGAGKKDES